MVRPGPTAPSILLVAVLAAACQGAPGAGDDHAEATALVAAYFSDTTRPCSAAAECPTGRCDLSPVFNVGISSGYCMTLAGAYERWQRLLLAEELGRRAQADEAVAAALAKRIQAELREELRPPEVEALVLLIQESGLENRGELLAELAGRSEGSQALLTGLALAAEGRPEGEAPLADAALSALVQLRLQAARAAGRSCSPRAAAVLRGLVDDPHPLVGDRALLALARCGLEPELVRERGGVAARLAAIEATDGHR